MAEGDRRTKDFWDIVEVIGKSVLAIGVTGGITFYGISVNSRLADEETTRVKLAEANRAAQTLIQLVNARESATSNLRAQMFKTLLETYFDHQSEESQIVVLELIGLNFRDAIQIKPMFERLDQQLSDDPGEARRKPRELLRKAAKSIIRDQLEQIDIALEGNTCKTWLKAGQTVRLDCFDLLAIELQEVEEARIRVRTNTRDGAHLPLDEMAKGDEFHVTFFDMPMVDYTRMIFGESPFLFSVVLLETDIESERAQVAVAVLPETNYSPNNAYKFDELVSEFLRDVSPME